MLPRFEKGWLPVGPGYGQMIANLLSVLFLDSGQKRMTQAQFARHLKVSERVVSDWKNARYQPSAEEFSDKYHARIRKILVPDRCDERHASQILAAIKGALAERHPRAPEKQKAPEAQRGTAEAVTSKSSAPDPQPPTSQWNTPDRLKRMVDRFDAREKPPNWSLQEHVAWSRFQISAKVLMNEWDPNFYYQKLARHCFENPQDAEALKALEAYQLWISPLVDPEEAFALVEAGKFPAFREFLDKRSQPSPLERYVMKAMKREIAAEKLLRGQS